MGKSDTHPGSSTNPPANVPAHHVLWTCMFLKVGLQSALLELKGGWFISPVLPSTLEFVMYFLVADLLS